MKKSKNYKLKIKGTIAYWMLLSSLFIIPLLSLVPSTKGDNWWDDHWAFRKQIIINHEMVNADLTNFPVLIDINDTDLKHKAQLDGEDIVFVANNVTLNHEIEQYDSTTGHLVAWVKIPSLSSSTNTTLYMYYGNPDATNQQNVSGVWDSNFTMVQHLEETSSSRYDSTVHGNNGTVYDSVIKSTEGKINGADELDGANDYVRIPDNPTLDITGNVTIEAWFNSKQELTSKPKAWYGGLGKISAYELGWQGWTDGWTFQIYQGGTRLYIDSRDKYMPPNEWHYVVGRYDGQNLTIFIDGNLVASRNLGAYTIESNDNPFLIGRCKWTYWNGTIDEVRISNVSRSTGWIKTCYNNQKDPNLFYTVYAEETSSDALAPLVSDETPTNGTVDAYTNPTLSIRVYDPQEGNMTIIFKQKVLNSWQEIQSFSNVRNGSYLVIPTGMNKLGTTYYWSVSVTNGLEWTNKTFSFTTTTKILQPKWVATDLSRGVSGVLTYDVDSDGIEEVFYAAEGIVVALKGTDGNEIWRVPDDSIGYWTQPQMADLNNDSTPEIVVPLERPAGLLVLHANNGTQYWRKQTDLGRETYSSPVICDIDGTGYPTIFFASTDLFHGLDGSGRITALSYNGSILHQTFAWRPCAGGLAIADTDGDGEFELYMGDRNMYLKSAEYGDNDYGKGVQSFWARNLTLRWSYPSVFCSSPIPILADVNNDEILDVIVGDMNGGVVVLNSSDGSAIRMYHGGLGVIPTHYQPSVCDIDRDGNLEILMADPHDDPLDPSNEWASDDIVVWDLVDWKVDQRIYLGKSFYGPQTADVDGDDQPEIIACNYKGIFVIDSSGRVLDGITGLEGKLNYAVAQDIDGDGYTEIIVSSQGGYVYAYDTPARKPAERPRTEVQFYSEYRRGTAEYVPPPGCQEPVITSINPPNNAEGISLSLSRIEFTLTDYQHDYMNYTITTTPDIGSQIQTYVTNGRHVFNITKELTPSATYKWTINITDGTHWTNKSFTFTTETLRPWWNINWQYRKKITIDHTKIYEDLYDFPVLINIQNDADIANGSQPDADDIAFTDANGIQLPHEIEYYDNTTGTIIAWVKAPHLSSNHDTILYIYYGNPTAEDQQKPTSVWDTHFIMVQHLQENSTTRYDSTVNHNDGTTNGNPSKSTNGKIDGADDFDGLDDYIRIPNNSSLDITGNLTIEAWFLSDQELQEEANGWYGGVRKSSAYELGWQGWTDGWTFQIYQGGSRLFVDSINAYMSSNEWHHIVGQYDGQYLKLFFDGQLIANKYIGSITIDINVNDFQIGIGKDNKYWNGSVDEVRISNAVRSDSWVFTSYINQKNPAEFYKIEKEEQIPEAPIIYAPSPPHKAENIPLNLTELSFNITDYQGDTLNYTVTTEPDIGSSFGINVPSSRFTVNVTGLQYSKTYTWTVNASDGKNSTRITFIFSTSPTRQPTQDNPLLVIDGNKNLVCYNQSTTDPDGDRVTNIYNWYRNGTSITNLLLPFETNSSTTVKDYSGYGNDGTVIGQVKWIDEGIVGGAYQFERGYIQIPGSNILDGGGQWSEITVECWINLASYQNVPSRIIARIPSYEIGVSGNKIFASIWTATGQPKTSGLNKITSNTPLQPGTWNHIVLTYRKGENLTLYVNGTITAYLTALESPTLNYTVQPTGAETPLYVGWFDYFKGKIDEVRVYPTCLSQQQIQQRFNETKNGQSNNSTIVNEELKDGETWYCEVTPNDSHQDGTTKTSNTVTIGSNNKPIAKDLTITPFNPKTDQNLTASYTYFDPEGDPENTTQTEIRWYKNNQTVPELNNSLTVLYNFTTKGDVWYFTVRPSDGKEFGDTYESPHVLIQNSPPKIDSYTPENETLKINETETINFTHVSSDLDNDTLTYSWLLDGTEKSTEQNWTYTTDYNSSGTHNVTLIVYDTDFATDQHQWTVIVHNVNRPPQISYLVISPAPAYTNDTLTANLTAFDPDGDNVTITYQWQKYNTTEGVWYNITGATNQTLGPENFNKTDQIKVICTPYDGQDYGIPQEANITISNCPPTISSVYPAETNITLYVNQTQVFNVTCYDIDGDNLTIQWYVNETSVLNQTNVYASSYTFNATEWGAGTYTLTVIVKDDESQTSHQWTLVVKQPP